MGTRLQKAVARAFELVTLTQVSRGTGGSYRTWQDRLSGRRGVTPAAGLELAAFLRKRSRALATAAERIEAAARLVKKGDG